jgi:hypothetical protein
MTKASEVVDRLLGENEGGRGHWNVAGQVAAMDQGESKPISGVEAEEGDTHVETTVREVLQLGVDGLYELFFALANEIESNQDELTNFDAPQLVQHLKACKQIMAKATGA